MKSKLQIYITLVLALAFTGAKAQYKGGYGRGDHMSGAGGHQIHPCVNPTNSGEIAAHQTICYGTTPAAFTSISEPAGYVGELEYRWQISTSSPTFDDIAGAIHNTYNHTGTLSQITWFRRLARVTCESTWIESNVVRINVDPLPVASVGGSTTICENGSHQVSGASALHGTIKWTHNGHGDLDNDEIIDPSYTPDATDAGKTVTLTLTVTSDNACTAATATAVYNIHVYPQFTAGEIVTTGETICYNTSASVIGSETLASGGDGSIIYSWKSSADGFTNSTLIDGAALESYTPGTLTQTTSFRRYAKDGTCNTIPVESVGTWTVTVQRLQQFRSISSGSWTTASKWEQYTGIGDEWITATEYPGQNPNGCPDPMVTILAGYEMQIATTQKIDIPNFKIEADGKLTVKSGGKLIIQEKLQMDEQAGAAIVVE